MKGELMGERSRLELERDNRLMREALADIAERSKDHWAAVRARVILEAIDEIVGEVDRLRAGGTPGR